MKTLHLAPHSKFSSLAILGVLCSNLSVMPALAVNLNYESLSSLEEPLAFDYQDITFSVTGLVDAAVAYQEQNDSSDSLVFGNFQISAETQLANSWTLGAAYFGEYSESQDDDYSDNAALYLGGVWGLGSVGNVTGLVREQTRRLRGVGNAELNFDDQLGELGDYGAAYIGRFGPAQFLATFDEDSNFEIGSTYQRPIDNKDYRFSLRYRESQYTPDNSVVTFDSKAFGFVSELTYGSTIFDLGLGAEQLTRGSFSADRKYLSFGASRKIGLFTFSGEAHFGDIEGQKETSYAAGLKVDIARGMSLNFGLNHSDADINLSGFSLLEEDDTKATMSLRYSF